MATPPVFVSGAILTAAQLNAAGLWLTGTTTVTSGTNCDVLGCFTSDFDSYRVVVSGLKTNTAGDVQITMLSGSTPAASNWTSGRSQMDYVTGTMSLVKGTAAANAYGTIGSAVASGVSLDIYNPFKTEYTSYAGVSSDSRGITGYINLTTGGQLGNTTSYDGLRVLGSGCTFTNCKVSVYGYR